MWTKPRWTVSRKNLLIRCLAKIEVVVTEIFEKNWFEENGWNFETCDCWHFEPENRIKKTRMFHFLPMMNFEYQCSCHWNTFLLCRWDVIPLSMLSLARAASASTLLRVALCILIRSPKTSIYAPMKNFSDIKRRRFIDLLSCLGTLGPRASSHFFGSP